MEGLVMTTAKHSRMHSFKRALLLLSKAYERLTHRCITVPTTTIWGSKMRVTLPEWVSSQIFLEGKVDSELTETLFYLLKPGQTFVDIGAHIGYFSLLACHRVGNSGQVHAIEPTPSTFEVLRTNLHGRNTRVYPFALWSEPASLTFYVCDQRFSNHNSAFPSRLPFSPRRPLNPRPITVKALKLDTLVEQQGIEPNVIKIDAEGAELHILRGAKHTLMKYRPIVILEIVDLGVAGFASGAQIVELMQRDYGYTPYEWREGNLEQHLSRERYNLTNLIFLPSENVP
ncbi:MAG: FkbM family methyltransferase [Anaerolineae bacterium]|nr:FkbM family methyltransferase [Anaerolineae bacterium]